MLIAKKLSFHDFMAEANSHYYVHHIAFGEEGDFYTSPEISPLFGELIGLSFVDMWQKMGSPQDFALIELGPGKGTLMSDILRVGARFWGRPDIHLVENSPRLRKVQEEALAGRDITWHNAFDEIVINKPFLLVANEFFDALPVRHLRRKEGKWEEKYVEAGVESYISHPELVSGSPFQMLNQVQHDIDCVEISPLTTLIFSEILTALKQQPGYALIIDYGYIEQPFTSTAQACRGNKRVNLYETPGEIDISAYVDFGNLVKLTEASGSTYYGPVTQAQFLMQLGLQKRLDQVLAQTDSPHKHLRAARILIDPQAMGAIFKVMAVASQDFHQDLGGSPELAEHSFSCNAELEAGEQEKKEENVRN